MKVLGPENMGHITPKNESCGFQWNLHKQTQRSLATDNLFQIQNQMCPAILGSDSPCYSASGHAAWQLKNLGQKNDLPKR